MKKIDLAYIIDDDEIIFYLTKEIIKSVQFSKSTETFQDGLHAINNLKEAIKKKEPLPDVILFDLNMPVMDGWEFVEEFLRLDLKKEIPLFVFTSSIDPADKEKANSFPTIKGFIQKPLTIHKLDKILRDIS